MSAVSTIGFVASRVAGSVLETLRHPFPPVVRIETTNHCNAHCTFCPRESIGRAKGFMGQELFEKVIDECAENSCPAIHLHNFGEPLLDKQLPERIRFAKDKGIGLVKLISNGALLRGDMSLRLLDSGLDEIKISIDGANAGEFNQLRVGLDHADVLNNTRQFRRMRDRRGSRTRPVIVAACTRTSDRRRTEKLLADVVDRIEYAREHNWTGARRRLKDLKLRKPCDRLWRTLTVLVNGDVSLCCLDYSGREILGNCHRQRIMDIWNNHRYRELRRWHRDSQQQRIPLCRNCSKCFV